MSRVIKFRLHCERTGKILAYEVFNAILNSGYYWVDASEPEEVRLCNTENYFRADEPFSIPRRAQFTGLLDANGVEIYESDIVSDHVGVGLVCYSEKHAGFRVVYGDGLAKWFYDYILNGERESIMVIGNSHQNQELLK